MSYALPNVTTADGYTPAATLFCPNAQVLMLTVVNKAAKYQLGVGIGAPQWDVEHFAVPGVWTLPAADAIQIRSAAQGAPAQVSVSAF